MKMLKTGKQTKNRDKVEAVVNFFKKRVTPKMEKKRTKQPPPPTTTITNNLAGRYGILHRIF